MSYSVYIDGELMPVTPSEITTKISNRNKTITLINDGEVNILKDPGLTEYSFDLLFPAVEYPFAVYPNGFRPAAYYMEMIERLKVGKTAFRLIISRFMPSGAGLFETNALVSLEDYTIKEKADEGFDVIVSLKLKQYKEFGVKNVYSVKNGAAVSVSVAPNTRATTKAPPATYQVKPGDSLWAICKAQLGDGGKYAEIAALNGISNPNTLTAGTVIRFA